MSNMSKRSNPGTHLLAGGVAGMMEALTCHPLDTIKVRMQLSRRSHIPGERPPSFLRVGKDIIARETPLGLYRGLGAVLVGIVPKMAIRFSSFESYKSAMAPIFPSAKPDIPNSTGIFLSGLMAGATEAVLVVTPMDVVKIRLQAQAAPVQLAPTGIPAGAGAGVGAGTGQMQMRMMGTMPPGLTLPKYRNAGHAMYTIVWEEGVGALYRGVILTAARQASNQAACFTAYAHLKTLAQRLQGDAASLPTHQHMLIGLISGAVGPLSNAPLDTIKTRLQQGGASAGGVRGWRATRAIGREILRKEGVRAFYKGITPRVMRVAPGQAVTFAVYERVRKWLEAMPAKSPKSAAPSI